MLINKARLPHIQNGHNMTLHTSQHTFSESFNKDDVKKLQSEIQIRKKGKRRPEKECVLKLMPVPELYQSFTVPGVNNCYHMSYLTPDRVLVNDYDTTILTNTTGDILFYQKHLCGGPHTLNSKYELIYIDMYYNICKLSKNLKTIIIIIPIKDCVEATVYALVRVHGRPSCRDVHWR